MSAQVMSALTQAMARLTVAEVAGVLPELVSVCVERDEICVHVSGFDLDDRAAVAGVHVLAGALVPEPQVTVSPGRDVCLYYVGGTVGGAQVSPTGLSQVPDRVEAVA